MKKALSLLLITLLLIGSVSFADTSTKAPASTLVSWKWLSENMKKELIILDTRSEKDYAKDHIKGAVNVTWQMFTSIKGKAPGDQGFGVVLGSADLEKVIGSLGIDGKKTVVVYGAGAKAWGEEGRIAWTLKYAGLSNVKMLNSGYQDRDSKLKLPVDATTPSPKAVALKLGKYNTALNVTTAQVKAQLGKAKIIDTRAFLEYNGAKLYNEKRGGHLPGAINLPFDTFFKSGTVKSSKEIVAMMSKKGIKKSDVIVVYCTKGIRSAHVTLILREAGYSKATNYDASFYEWAGNASLPLK